MTSYSYSLDREIWQGSFKSRADAAAAGIEHGRRETTPPETVYVGQRIEPHVRAYGHARMIIKTMRRRMLEDNGDMADQFLRKPTDKQIGELDAALEKTIRKWLEANEFMPSWVRVEAVGEYAMPAPARHGNGQRDGEVHEIGVGEQPSM